jgi:hypothetical protein
VPTHPDRAGGLGFLSNIAYAFMPLLLPQGALYAGMIANRILFLGAKLPAFKIDLVLVGAVLLSAVLGPLLLLHMSRRVTSVIILESKCKRGFLLLVNLQ